MKGIREIKGRIKSVKNTAQITRAMQLVAASKMKRAQDKTLKAREYTLLLAEIIASMPGHIDEGMHPLLMSREIKKRGVLVVSTDKGLCGALNSNLFRMIPELEEEHKLDKDSVAYVAIGRKATQFLARSDRNLIADFTISDNVDYSEVRLAVEFMIKAYVDGEIDTIDIIYPRFVNTLVQEPNFMQLVPVFDLKDQLEQLRKDFGGSDTVSVNDDRELNFEPSPAEIMEELPELYVKNQVYHRILELKASEQSARMVAMKSATDNANNLVDSLTLEYNKARQASITQEILELAAGSQAS